MARVRGTFGMPLRRQRWMALVGMTGLLLTQAMVPAPTYASESGRRNMFLLLSGGAVYSVLQKKPVQGLALGAAGLYAYKRYRDEKADHRARHAAGWGYRRGYRTGRAHRRR